MSNIYIQEPPTKGKVLLITSVGEIDIELWSKECPKTCRNFIQLCMEGYYDGTVFHRVIKDFIAQGGDPTGTGNGGESIYGKSFKDEFHSRLRFNRRGLVAMANAGPNNNDSQFFFTLGEASELNKKHTLFGKITGPTVYNMLKLGECETDSNDRPKYLQKIISTRILNNPFDDILPREIYKKNVDNNQKKVSRSKATKNFKLLSFGEEAEEDEEMINEATEQMRGKSKSSHDLIDDPKLSSVSVIHDDPITTKTSKKRSKDSIEEEDSVESSIENVKKKLKKETENESSPTEVEQETVKQETVKQETDKPKELSRKEELRNEVRQLQKELKEAKRRKQEKNKQTSQKTSPESEEETESTNDAVLDFKKEQLKYKELKGKNKKKGSGREEETLAILAKFKTRLQSVREQHDEETEEKIVDINDETNDDIEGDSWLAHKLTFIESKQKVLDANVDELDRYEIFDPRNPVTKRRREQSKIFMKAKKT
ncbi:spliceosome-associated protein CWC27 homolog [Tubulanus polymorphus]|uniref:spliceosome-associated protein CWC27 homolog n=1 Tax=Tubulanus polymorphus TaxID=672921 RepID=UPI003DA26670